jgi:hypothetical protein
MGMQIYPEVGFGFANGCILGEDTHGIDKITLAFTGLTTIDEKQYRMIQGIKNNTNCRFYMCFGVN